MIVPHADRAATRARIGGTAAAVLGFGSAVVSAYWALGGEALLDTVGGDIERWGRERGTSVVLALWGVVFVKIVVGSASLLATRLVDRAPAWMSSRMPRALSWVSAIVLTVYGGLLTVVGLLVQINAVDSGRGADEKALRWHTLFWDPWFLLWGTMFIVAMRASRPATSPPMLDVHSRRSSARPGG